MSVDKTNHAIHWIVIYPVDSVIHFSNNWGQVDIVIQPLNNWDQADSLLENQELMVSQVFQESQVVRV